MKPNPNLHVVLYRHWEDWNQSTGSLVIVDKNDNCQPIFVNVCIERGDRDNAQGESNCPPGTYKLVWEHSPKYGMVWELKGVPDGRTELKIHPANFWDDLRGCIAPGAYLSKLDSDGYYDTISSRKTLERFHDALEPMKSYGTTITIVDPIDIW